MKRKINIPIYDAVLYIVVSDNIHEERGNMVDLFGEAPKEDYIGCCSYNDSGEYALFFDTMEISHKTIAHEIFHLTHRITEWRYGSFCEKYHEVFADLCGYLTEQVYNILISEQIKV